MLEPDPPTRLVDQVNDVAYYVELDDQIDAAEDDAIRRRWEFGRALLMERNGGKQLPNGRLAEVCEATAKSRAEVQRRVAFAERFPTEAEVSHAVRHFRSWHQIVNDALGSTSDADPPAPVDPPEGLFSTIVIDPPWRYDNVATRGAAEDHYQTMTLDELAELDIPAADDAHLYLWVTNGFIRQGFDLIEQWGFTYKTCLTWCKPQIGMGNWFRNTTEHVLFAVRGRLPTDRNDVPTHFVAPRTRHSAKPESFYDLVERCSPGPRLEMFARRRRLGWEVWGNEA